jgi:hypothetical protein
LIPAGSPKPDRLRGQEPDKEIYLEDGKMMLEMVQDRIATGVTRVV